MSNQDLLREKAALIYQYCASADLPQPKYRITSEYAVDLIWRYEGKNHTLSLYYRPKNQRWTVDAKSDWLKHVVVPLIQPLFEQSLGQSNSLPSVVPVPAQVSISSTPQVYFVSAIASLSLLEPFANDNIDFSIICQRTREAVKMVLRDPTCSHLDCAALTAAVDIPDSNNFPEAKEYLLRCLTLCNINNAVN